MIADSQSLFNPIYLCGTNTVLNNHMTMILHMLMKLWTVNGVALYVFLSIMRYNVLLSVDCPMPSSVLPKTVPSFFSPNLY
jgi:hypothetical protein